ncbi:MAG TPA: EAL domain-containing protein [Thermoanaerobaculia bacterium]|nr:EAL domain-containing protein [Thermoanaerobaculia bacterium]
MVVGLSLYVLLYIIWFLLPRLTAADRALASVFAQIPAGLAAAVLSLLASRPAGLQPRARRAWRLLATGFALYALGDLIWLLTYVGIEESRVLAVARLSYFSHYVFVLLGLVSFQRFPKNRRERMTFGLDAATVFLGGLMAIWYFAIGPIASQAHANPNMVYVQMAFALADLQVLLGIAVNGVGRGEERYRAAFMTLLTGLVALLAGDIIYAQSRVAGITPDGGPADLIFMLRWLFVGLAAYMHLRVTSRGETAIREGLRSDRFDLLPLVAVGIGYLTLTASSFEQWSSTRGGLILAAVGLTGVVLARQVTAVRENVRLAGEAAARQTEARFRSLVQNASDLIVVVDEEGIVRYQTPSAERVLGYGAEALVGTRIVSLLPAEDAASIDATLAPARQKGASAPAEWRLRRGDGRWTRAEIIATNLLDDPNVRGVVLTIRDIEERKHFEEQLRHQALHDSLTGLPNRALLADRVSHAQARGQRGGLPSSLLLLDLDDFKTINDSMGHSAGDDVLVEVAKRLKSCLRSIDTAARLGGDEFAVLLEDTPDEVAALDVANRIASALRAPMRIAGTEVSVSASVGIVLSGRDELEGEIFRNADVAMYQAKKRGKGLCEVYEPGMHAAVLERLQLEADLRRAVALGEIVLHFQPIVDFHTGAWVGAEALARWSHPTRGLILPSSFIPVAEATGLILAIGRHVLEEACRFAGEWGRDRHVSVNLSARQLQEPGIVTQVVSALRHTGLRPDQLVLEITESVLMIETESTIQRLNELKALGVRVAIDDFGTGYSSLAYLEKLPVDILKLDQSFIRGLAPDGDLSPVARGVIDLGRALDLEIVAEGIERQEEANALIRAGCTRGQGYYFARPMEPHDLRRHFVEARVKVS